MRHGLLAAPDAAETEAAVALLRRMVEADSINPPGPTTGPAGAARAVLEGAGIAVDVFAARPEKPNLAATLANGSGRHVVLNAHLDTVPPGDRAAWTVPPLELTEKNGRLFGLGTGNMKAAAASMVFSLLRLHAMRGAWAGTVTLTLVSDECVFGPDGAAHLLAARPDLRGDLLICGEGPGNMQLAVAEKGLMWVRLTAKGRVGQGMLTTRGSSAPARLAPALAAIDAWNEIAVAPPLPSLGHSGNAQGCRLSANVGRIGGGQGFSPAVSEAVADIDFRLPPGLSRAEIACKLDALCAEGGLAWREVKGWEPNWSAPDSVPARAVRHAATVVRGGQPGDVTRLPASDASRWRALGVPAVCFGPQPELASGADDHVIRGDFLDCIPIYASAAAHGCQLAG